MKKEVWNFVCSVRRHSVYIGLWASILDSSHALDFLIEIGGEDLLTEFRARAYVSFIIKMMLAFGIGFEFPLILILLQKLEIVTYKTLRKQWRYAVVGIVVLVAIITPSGDPISLLALAVPMYLFYEAAVLYGWRARTEIVKGTE